MGYINPTWLQVDKHSKHAYDAGLYTDVEVDVDAELYRMCADRGITIPVDGSGYVDSVYLQTIATSLALWKLLSSASGVNDNDNDEYERKALANQQDYLISMGNLCYSKV